MPLPKIDTYKYIVEPFDDDFTGRLSWGVLGKHVLACAERHAGARGFDRLQRGGHHYLWVLSRMAFDIQQWPRLGEHYAITTWVRRYYRYFTDRCFELLDAEGHIIGRVFTIWAMIDSETRRPQDLETLFGHSLDQYIDLERPFPTPSFSRVKIKTERPEAKREMLYTDIDENNHVNSIRYIELILDTFPKDFFETNEVSHLEIAYNSEALCGDELSFYVSQTAGDTYNIIVRKNTDIEPMGGETVCHSLVRFKTQAKATINKSV